MQRTARRALVVAAALWFTACGGSDAPAEADSGSGNGQASVPPVVDTSLPADSQDAQDAQDAQVAGGTSTDASLPSADTRGFDGDAVPAAAPPRTAPVDRAGAPALDIVAPPTPLAPDSVPIMPAAPAAPPVVRREEPVRRPFEVGERLTYEVRFGPLAVGAATMEVLGVTTVRGIPAYHTRFEVRGGNRLYRVHDRYESWFDIRNLASLRYMQDINQGNYDRTSVFEIYPDERRFVEQGKEPHPSVEHPLDEGSFIYWMRTIPLEVGQTYSFDRYFRPDRNPVRIEVLRRERVTVPAGTFDAIVVRPVIRTRGIFSEGGRAEIWFADDSTRRIIQLRSRLSFGSLNLYLK